MLSDKRLPTFQLILHLFAKTCHFRCTNHDVNGMSCGRLGQMNGDDHAVAAVVSGSDLNVHILILVKPDAWSNHLGASTTGPFHQLDGRYMLLLHRKSLTFTNFRNRKKPILVHLSSLRIKGAKIHFLTLLWSMDFTMAVALYPLFSVEKKKFGTRHIAQKNVSLPRTLCIKRDKINIHKIT